MTDLFSRLARRTLGESPGFSARLPARFEPAQNRGDAPEAAPNPDPQPPRSARDAPGPQAKPGLPDRSGSGHADTSSADRSTAPRNPASPVESSTRPARQQTATPENLPTGDRAPVSEEPLLVVETHGHEAAGQARDRGHEVAAAARDQRPATRVIGAPPTAGEHAEARAAVPPLYPEAESGPPSGRANGDDFASRFHPLLSPRPSKHPDEAPAAGPSSARGPSGGEPAIPPAVEVSIGTIEVRAAVPATPAAPAPSGPTLTLDDYLKRRRQGDQ